MHRLTALTLALLVLFATVVPSVLARETNADRLKRGEPPLPPTPSLTAKRHQTSHITVTGIVQVRNYNNTGILLGTVINDAVDYPGVFRVVDPSDLTADILQAKFSSSSGTLIATNFVFPPPPPVEPFPPPFYMGGHFVDITIPTVLLTIIPDPLDPYSGVVWTYNLQTHELKLFLLSGVEVGIIWQQNVNVLQILTEQQVSNPGEYELYEPDLVRLFLVPNSAAA